MPPEYHMDLPLKGDVNNILDIGKDCHSKGFLPCLLASLVSRAMV